jgi:glutaredoxin
MSATEPEVQLLVSEWCPSCHQAETVWQQLAGERTIRFNVVDMAQPEGRELVKQLRIRSVPAVVVDGELAAVGLLERSRALELVPDAAPKAASATRHIGLGLAGSSRAALSAAAVYLVLAGLFLFLEGWGTGAGLLAGSAFHPGALHLFTLGFLSFFIYGLGEHMLPRFTGQPLPMGVWSWTQQGLAHAGVLAFFIGHGLGLAGPALLGALLAWLALALFAWRIVPVVLRASDSDPDQAGGIP